MQYQGPPFHVKFIASGDGFVGKSSLLIRWATREFPHEYVPPTFDNYTVNTHVHSLPVSVGFWDTNNKEGRDSIRPLSYKDDENFLICFSVVDPRSFQSVSSKWFPEADKYCPKGVKILCGTKN